MITYNEGSDEYTTKASTAPRYASTSYPLYLILKSTLSGNLLDEAHSLQ